MKITFRTAKATLISLFAIFQLIIAHSVAAAPELTIGNYQLVSSTRISRVEYDYTYSATVTNTGRDAQEVTAYLNLTVNGVTILDDKLDFGDVLGGSSVESINTFTVRQNRTSTFNTSDVKWNIYTANLSFSTPPDLEKVITDSEGATYPVNQLLILLENGYLSVDAENIASAINARVIGVMGNIYQLEIPSNTSEELGIFVSKLKSDQRIQSVSHNTRLQLQYQTDLAHLREKDDTLTAAYDKLNLDKAWNAVETLHKETLQVTIGMVDSGININHSEFDEEIKVNITSSQTVDPGGRTACGSVLSHGTGVAGIIGANNLSSLITLPPGSPQMNGILSGVSSMNYQLFVNPVSPNSNEPWTANVITQVKELINLKVNIVNISMGGIHCDQLSWWEKKVKVCDCIEKSVFDDKKALFESTFSGNEEARKVLFIVSAGNADKDAAYSLPGGVNIPNLITVGASTLNNEKADFSNMGDNVNIAAPGEKVYAPSTYDQSLDQSSYKYSSGTSFSAPMVTGVAGLIQAIKPGFTPYQIKKILIQTGTPLPDQKIGPLVNAHTAVCHEDVLNCSATKLNDTGITTCSDNSTNGLPCPVAGFPGQDSEHGRDALAQTGLLQKVGDGNAGFDFTKLDANGNTLSVNATDWSCVKDNHTGLIWEVKTNDDGLQDMNNTYTWYEPDNSKNGGDPGLQNAGSCMGSDCDTHGYVQAVNIQGLCGASDWRMPTHQELRSIMDYSRWVPAIDTNYFPNTGPLFWSSSPFAGGNNNNLAWAVNLFSGMDDWEGKSFSYWVRLVRDGK